jgi:hypothetical protein
VLLTCICEKEKENTLLIAILYFRVISSRIVLVEKFLSNGECGLDGRAVLSSRCSSGKMFVDMIHSWDHFGKVGCFTRKE